MLGNKLITKQTGPQGVPVRSVMLAESIDFDRELYFAILLDRSAGGPVIVASTYGGMDIEAVAESHPEAILKVFFISFFFCVILIFLFFISFFSLSFNDLISSQSQLKLEFLTKLLPT